MKYLLSLLLLLCLSACQTATESHSSQFERQIYLVRHAEKQVDGTDDPALTELGLLRAKRIANLLESKDITIIYSTDYKRTLQTAAPLAKKLKLRINSYNPRQLADFATKVNNTKGNILIVGHSNTTPELVNLLGGDGQGPITEFEYKRLYQLTVNQQGVTTLLLNSD